MRTSGRPMTAAGAAAVLLALGPVTMATAATASPLAGGLAGHPAAAAAVAHDPGRIGSRAQPAAVSHGCPGGDVCLYGSQSAFKKDSPAVLDTDVPGLHSGGVLHNAVVVNNVLKYYASEGVFQARYFKGTEFCEYVPDPKDEQDPNRIEDPADGAQVTAIASGSESVFGPFPVSLSYCEG